MTTVYCGAVPLSGTHEIGRRFNDEADADGGDLPKVCATGKDYEGVGIDFDGVVLKLRYFQADQMLYRKFPAP